MKVDAQDAKFSKAISETNYNNVTEYICNELNNDTTLHVKEYYNELGFRTEIEVYNDEVVEFDFKYIYRFDSILRCRKQFVSNILSDSTVYFYSNDNLLTGFKTYVPGVDEPVLISKYRYDELRRLSDIETFQSGVKLSERNYRYSKTGELKSVKSAEYNESKRNVLTWNEDANIWYKVLTYYEPKSSIGYLFKEKRKRIERYSSKGKPTNPHVKVLEVIDTEVLENVEEWSKKSTLRFKTNEDVYYVGVNGGTVARKGSEVSQISYYNENDLKLKMVEHLNDKLTGIKIFKYDH